MIFRPTPFNQEGVNMKRAACLSIAIAVLALAALPLWATQQVTVVGESLKQHGFEHVVFIGDSGGNQSGMENAAAALNERWGANRAHFVPEFYRYRDVFTYMEEELGIAETQRDGHHDDYVITTLMMVTDPETVRWQQRVAAGQASINGLSIADQEQAIEIGKKLMQFRVDTTVEAINAAIGASTAGR